MSELDERGWIFLGSDGNPYRCCMWGDAPWLFGWHPDNHWVSLSRLTQYDIWMLPHNLTEAQQEWYRRAEAKTVSELMPDFKRQQRDESEASE